MSTPNPLPPTEKPEPEGFAGVPGSALTPRVFRMSDEAVQSAIERTHPMANPALTGDALEPVLDADLLALSLVSQRHAKRALVDLVRWLLLGAPNSDSTTKP